MLAQRHALTAIRSEHRALAGVLRVLEQCATQLTTDLEPEVVTRIAAALEYITTFPDRFHHPKEEEFLFARLRSATHEADKILGRLEEEHRSGNEARARLKEVFNRIVLVETAVIKAFAVDASTYVAFQFEHMRVEEDIVLPLAERTLSADDWHAIASAFLDDSDPRFGWDARDEFSKLLLQIQSMSATFRKK